MTSRPPIRNAIQDLVLPLAVVVLTALQAVPSIFEAWGNDVYAHGAPLACVIWLAPQVWWRMINRHAPAQPRLIWLGLALLLCVIGTMTELRVLQHLALACSITGAFGWRFFGFVTNATALAWLPASGWFLSHWKSSGLVGWERPVFAFILAIFLLARVSYASRASHANSPKP